MASRKSPLFAHTYRNATAIVRLALLFCAALLFVPFANSQTTITAGTATTHEMSNASSANFSHTTAAGDDRLLLLGISAQQPGASVTSVTYAGQSLTKVGNLSNSSQSRVEIWQLVNPPVGTHQVLLQNRGIDRLLERLAPQTNIF